MGHRGRETQVRCEKCGREVRRDKALFIEKAIFSNPLERKDVYSETYDRVLTREVSYCISCGKHARLFQKKKQQQERARERERMGRFSPRPGGFRPQRQQGYSQAPASQPATQPQAQQQADSAPAPAQEAKPSSEQQSA
ncbi:TPA: hypothetical protein HA244_03125 [Candidatus Micrarchaeota archaeon]|nr:hypothetical protein [Candidatus Micrarchaeota archaeon]